MNLKELEFEEIRTHIQSERQKGRTVREIVTELAAGRDDVVLLSPDLAISEQQIIKLIESRKETPQSSD